MRTPWVSPLALLVGHSEALPASLRRVSLAGGSVSPQAFPLVPVVVWCVLRYGIARYAGAGSDKGRSAPLGFASPLGIQATCECEKVGLCSRGYRLPNKRRQKPGRVVSAAGGGWWVKSRVIRSDCCCQRSRSVSAVASCFSKWAIFANKRAFCSGSVMGWSCSLFLFSERSGG